MVRLIAAFALILVACPVAFGEASADPWQSEIDALTTNDRARPPPRHGVLFVGSSSIRMWTTLAADFPGVPVINRGFGGSMIPDSTNNAGRLVIACRPNLVVLYAGDNDIEGGHAPAQVIADFKAFVARLRHDLPRVEIAFVSIKPSVARAALWPRMREANAGIAGWAHAQRGIHYVDIASKMLDANGSARPELFLADGLHMNREGYAIWVEALQPLLARFRKVPARAGNGPSPKG
jgi:lysophospholipase L1-like esterase